MAYQLSETPEAIDFHFIKAAHFRIIHVDGAWGGVTPSQNIAVGFFSERLPIPTIVQHQLEEGGNLGEELERDSKTGIVREMEVELVMNKATATGFLEWFKTKVGELA